MILKTNTEDLVQFKRSPPYFAVTVLCLGGLLWIMIAFIGISKAGLGFFGVLISFLPGIAMVLAAVFSFSNHYKLPRLIEINRMDGCIKLSYYGEARPRTQLLSSVKSVDLKEEKVRASVANSALYDPTLYHLSLTWKDNKTLKLCSLNNKADALLVLNHIRAMLGQT